MEELQIINLDKTDITAWDFPALKVELEAYLSEYAGLVYTDETIKDAKKDRSTLNKAKKVIEDAGKAYKARCLEPYEAIKPQINDLTGLIEERRRQIDETVKEYENRQKETKEKKIREYFDRISGSLGPDADRIYQKIFDPKWTNASTSAAKYRDEIQNAVASVVRDLEDIKALNSRFADKLKEVYLDTLSMDKVRQKNDEWDDVEKASFTNVSNENAGTVSVFEATSSETPKADEAEGTLVRIHASQDRLNQICDFMKAIGVIYEIV